MMPLALKRAMTIKIVKDFMPGCIGRITEMHGAYYHQHAGFGTYFEGKVAAELSEFLQRYDANRDGIWLVLLDGKIEGSIVIDGLRAHEEGARLRWFILSDRLRGSGSGNALLSAAVNFCRAQSYERVYLWTFDGLDAARHLYEKYGFHLIKEQRGVQFGSEVKEQCFELLTST
jgi:GNAT superfamily N-acetyltransferase